MALHVDTIVSGSGVVAALVLPDQQQVIIGRDQGKFEVFSYTPPNSQFTPHIPLTSPEGLPVTLGRTVESRLVGLVESSEVSTDNARCCLAGFSCGTLAILCINKKSLTCTSTCTHLTASSRQGYHSSVLLTSESSRQPLTWLTTGKGVILAYVGESLLALREAHLSTLEPPTPVELPLSKCDFGDAIVWEVSGSGVQILAAYKEKDSGGCCVVALWNCECPEEYEAQRSESPTMSGGDGKPNSRKPLLTQKLASLGFSPQDVQEATPDLQALRILALPSSPSRFAVVLSTCVAVCEFEKSGNMAICYVVRSVADSDAAAVLESFSCGEASKPATRPPKSTPQHILIRQKAADIPKAVEDTLLNLGISVAAANVEGDSAHTTDADTSRQSQAAYTVERRLSVSHSNQLRLSKAAACLHSSRLLLIATADGALLTLNDDLHRLEPLLTSYGFSDTLASGNLGPFPCPLASLLEPCGCPSSLLLCVPVWGDVKILDLEKETSKPLTPSEHTIAPTATACSCALAMPASSRKVALIASPLHGSPLASSLSFVIPSAANLQILEPQISLGEAAGGLSRMCAWVEGGVGRVVMGFGGGQIRQLRLAMRDADSSEFELRKLDAEIDICGGDFVGMLGGVAVGSLGVGASLLPEKEGRNDEITCAVEAGASHVLVGTQRGRVLVFDIKEGKWLCDVQITCSDEAKIASICEGRKNDDNPLKEFFLISRAFNGEPLLARLWVDAAAGLISENIDKLSEMNEAIAKLISTSEAFEPQSLEVIDSNLLATSRDGRCLILNLNNSTVTQVPSDRLGSCAASLRKFGTSRVLLVTDKVCLLQQPEQQPPLGSPLQIVDLPVGGVRVVDACPLDHRTLAIAVVEKSGEGVLLVCRLAAEDCISTGKQAATFTAQIPLGITHVCASGDSDVFGCGRMRIPTSGGTTAEKGGGQQLIWIMFHMRMDSACLGAYSFANALEITKILPFSNTLELPLCICSWSVRQEDFKRLFSDTAKEKHRAQLTLTAVGTSSRLLVFGSVADTVMCPLIRSKVGGGVNAVRQVGEEGKRILVSIRDDVNSLALFELLSPQKIGSDEVNTEWRLKTLAARNCHFPQKIMTPFARDSLLLCADDMDGCKLLSLDKDDDLLSQEGFQASVPTYPLLSVIPIDTLGAVWVDVQGRVGVMGFPRGGAESVWTREVRTFTAATAVILDGPAVDLGCTLVGAVKVDEYRVLCISKQGGIIDIDWRESEPLGNDGQPIIVFSCKKDFIEDFEMGGE